MISIRFHIDYVPFTTAKSYHAFEAFSETIRFCSIDTLKTDVVFLQHIKNFLRMLILDEFSVGM